MIKRRLDALESRSMAASPATRRWFGEALSPAEHLLADEEDARALPPLETSTLPKEVLQWLQQ